MELKDIYEFISKLSKSNVKEVKLELPDFKLKVEFKEDYIKLKTKDNNFEKSIAEENLELVEIKNEDIQNKTEESKNYHVIKSPMVGTFYRKPSPDAEPFVKEGDIVKKGQTLALIEALKVFNEIESDIDGKIVKILVEDGSPVEYGQELFYIEPLNKPLKV